MPLPTSHVSEINPALLGNLPEMKPLSTFEDVMEAFDKGWLRGEKMADAVFNKPGRDKLAREKVQAERDALAGDVEIRPLKQRAEIARAEGILADNAAKEAARAEEEKIAALERKQKLAVMERQEAVLKLPLRYQSAIATSSKYGLPIPIDLQDTVAMDKFADKMENAMQRKFEAEQKELESKGFSVEKAQVYLPDGSLVWQTVATDKFGAPVPNMPPKTLMVIKTKAQLDAEEALKTSSAVDQAKQIADVKAAAEAPENARKAAAEENEFRVPLLGPSAKATSKQQASDTNKLGASVLQADQSIDQLIGLIGEAKRLKWSEKDWATSGKVAVLRNTLVGSLRVPIAGPGALTESERAMLFDIVAKPGDFLSFDESIETKLITLKEVLDRGFTNTAKSVGVENPVWPPGSKATGPAVGNAVEEFTSPRFPGKKFIKVDGKIKELLP